MKKLISVILVLILLCAACASPAREPSAELPGEPAPTAFLTPSPAPVYEGEPLPDDDYRVFYEIFVGSYCDSDDDGSGDLQGILQKLDYLNDGNPLSKTSLGVEGIWLMPIMASPSYHKYDAADYYSVDPEYGTTEDFRQLAEACDERGIRLIIDLVLNHTSDRHPWFTSAIKSIGVEPCGNEVCTVPGLCRAHNPYCGYYRFSCEQLADYHPVPGAPGWYYEGVFSSGMPDLDLENEAVREELSKVMRYWQDMGADGFRLDAVTSYFSGNIEKNVEFLKWIRSVCEQKDEDAYIVGEVWADSGTVLSYYRSGIDSFFNYPFAQSEGVIIKNVRSGSGAKLANSIESWQADMKKADPSAIDAPFLSNHDNARSGGALMRDLVKQKMAAASYLLMPGSPFTYYGEELGMLGSGRDENKRMPFVWSALDSAGQAAPPAGADNTEKLEAGKEEQLKDENSLLRFYIDAIALRRLNPEIARGSAAAVDTGAPGISALRFEYNGSAVSVVHNFSSEQVCVPLTALNASEIRGTLNAGGKDPYIEGDSIVMPAASSCVVK